jgi:hypothetical protein
MFHTTGRGDQEDPPPGFEDPHHLGPGFPEPGDVFEGLTGYQDVEGVSGEWKAIGVLEDDVDVGSRGLVQSGIVAPTLGEEWLVTSIHGVTADVKDVEGKSSGQVLGHHAGHFLV